MPKTTDYKVADMSLSDWGHKEIEIAQAEMPGLMAIRDEYKGQEPPEWMSTHPSSSRRIESLKKWIPEITFKYPPIKKIG